MMLKSVNNLSLPFLRGAFESKPPQSIHISQILRFSHQCFRNFFKRRHHLLPLDGTNYFHIFRPPPPQIPLFYVIAIFKMEEYCLTPLLIKLLFFY